MIRYICWCEFDTETTESHLIVNLLRNERDRLAKKNLTLCLFSDAGKQHSKRHYYLARVVCGSELDKCSQRSAKLLLPLTGIVQVDIDQMIDSQLNWKRKKRENRV